MADSLDDVSRELRALMAEVHGRAERLSPLDIRERMDAIGQLAATEREKQAVGPAQLALLPGCRVGVCQAAA